MSSLKFLHAWVKKIDKRLYNQKRNDYFGIIIFLLMYKDHETPRYWISYGKGLEKYIAKRVKDKMLAEDVLHDVYIKIFCHCKRGS